MSGSVKSNVFGTSGTITAAAGGLKWEAVVTASTVTVESNRGYFINTTSNACTITLPASPGVGDQIIFLDYARTWDTNAITIDSNGNDFQNQSDVYTVDYDTEGQGINIVFSGATNGWIPNSDVANALTPVAPPTQKAIFYGGSVAVSNLVNSSGVVASDIDAVGSGREGGAGATYGGDKGIIFGGALNSNDNAVGITNLINNSGVVGNDVSIASGVRTAADVAGSSYGGDKAIAYGGYGNGNNAMYNLITNVGVVGANANGTPTGRNGTAGSKFGSTGQAIFAYGTANINISFHVTNVGVPGSNRTGVGTARKYIACASFGGDRCVFAFGSNDNALAVSNKVSNTGVVASDTGAVGTARFTPAGVGYGGDKGIIFGGKFANGNVGDQTNLVSNSGVVAADITAVGTARRGPIAAGFSFSA